MYLVTINGNSQTVKAFTAAKASVQSAASSAAIALTNPVNPKLYRSPKTAQAINDARLAQAQKLIGLKLPKLVGNVSVKVGDFTAYISPLSK